MLRAKTGQQKFPTLKKTTGLCPSRCCYSMLCCKSRMVPTVQYVWQIHVSSPPSPSPHPFCYWAAFCWESCRFLWSAPANVFTNIFPVLLFPYLLPEPGPLQHCRDNATMFSGQQIVEHGIYVYTRCGYSTEDIFRIFSCLWSCITLSHCRCWEAYKLSRAQLCIAITLESLHTDFFCWLRIPQPTEKINDK